MSLVFCVDAGKPGEIILENMIYSNGGIQESAMVCQLRDFKNKNYRFMMVGDIAQSVERLPITFKDLGSILTTEKPELVV